MFGSLAVETESESGMSTVAACFLVWEAAFSASKSSALAATRGGMSRLWISCTARPTLLLVVATLSYANVVQGRSISLGKADWIVWLPAIVLVALGAGSASTSRHTGAWIALLAWSSIVTIIVCFCFSRLLLAILRVRQASKRHESETFSACGQGRAWSQGGSSISSRRLWLPMFHSNFSDLSTSFIGTFGRTSSPTARHDTFLPCSTPKRAAFARPPSLGQSFDSDDHARAATPGSNVGLLAGIRHSLSVPSITIVPSPTTSSFSLATTQRHSMLSFEEISRPSLEFEYASGVAGLAVNGGSVRAIQRAWAGQTPPGTGNSTQVELSNSEARGALIRIGGHLLTCILGFVSV